MSKKDQKLETEQDLLSGFQGQSASIDFPFMVNEKPNIDFNDEEEEEEEVDDKDTDVDVKDSKKDKPEDQEDEESDDSDEDETNEESQEDEESDDVNPILGFLSYLKEEDVLEIDEDLEIEPNEEGLKKVIKHNIEQGVNEYKNSLPNVVKEFSEYVELGGDPRSFLNSISEVDYANLDLDKESNQKLVVSQFLKKQDWSDEDIEQEIEDLEDAEKLERMSKRYATKLQKEKEKNIQQLKEQQEIEYQNRVKEYNDKVNNIQSIVESSNTILDMGIKKSEKPKFVDFMLKADKQGKTEYQKFLENEGEEAMVKLAFLAYKKFDLKPIKKKGEQAATSKLNDVLSNYSSRKPKTGSQSATKIDPKKPDYSKFRLY